MSTAGKPPCYTIEVEPSKKSPGTYEWPIRERGKVLHVRAERRSHRELLEIEESYQCGCDRRALVLVMVDQIPGNER